MSVPTFVDLQGFIINNRLIVKEVAVLRRGTVLAHYIFRSPVPWHLLTKSEKSQALWLRVNHHGLQWEDGIVAYSMAKQLITTAVVEDNDEMSCTVYVKGRQKREWLANMLDDNAKENLIIETLDADYDDIESLNNLDVKNTMRCGKHVKNCALQNVFKIFNWWSQRQKELQYLEK
ncbi:hypothetical protein RF55_7568 [Lasius niger]|uniref:Uncharacterized protein n=1 Tax=Lasius niger TaxID=67767 RepID=A0A0J7KQB0_LASNI|nr:hypothetical protein RF55_18867 [Lasius niger]KMQ92434.1 hypothetical protein RF55_7568 [Lasius niger]